MLQIVQVLNTILPVVLILVIGMICRKTNMISREGIGALKSVVVNITLPAVMLNAFASMKYCWKNVVITVMMFLICLIAWFLGKLLKSLFHWNSGFIPFLCTGFEAGMLGYALFSLLYGNEHLGDFATVDLGQVLFVFTVYKLLLGKEMQDASNRVNMKKLLKEMFTSSVVIAIITGVILGATGIYQACIPLGISTIFDACTSFVSAPTSAIILLTIGYDLVFQKIPWKKVTYVCVLRLLIMTFVRVLAGVVVHLLGMGDALDLALNVMFILPAPFVLPVFADDENEREYVSASLSVMTVITIIGFMIMAIFSS